MYPPVVSNVSNQQFTPDQSSFGVPLVLGTVTADQATAWALLDTPRTLAVTPNNYKATMEALGFSESDAHWKHVVAFFAQRPNGPRVTTMVLGRRLDPVAKVVRVTIGAATDGEYSIQVEAETPLAYTASGNTVTEIRDALLALFAGHAVVSVASSGTDAIDFTAANAGFNFTLTLASPGDNMTQAVQTENVGIGDDLDACRAENDVWFDIFETSHGTAAILEGAKWAQVNISHFHAETNDSAVKTNAAGNVAAILKEKGYTETNIRYHHTGAELLQASLGGAVLAFEPGQIQISHRRLIGVTRKNYSAEAGVIEAFEANNVGWYDSSGGGRVLYNRTCHGGFIEMERNKWIVSAKLTEKKLALLSDNNIVAYTDEEGVAAAKAAVQEGLNEYATGGGTGYIIRDTIEITVKAIEDMSSDSQSELGIEGIEWSAFVRIGTNRIESSGFLSFVDA